MKQSVTIILTMLACLVFLSGVCSAGRAKQMYQSEIEKIISFYENRLYLLDSEYQILSDIGRDAKTMLNYLYGKKHALVKEMHNKNMRHKSKKIRAFVVNKARMSDKGFAYTKP